MKTTQAKPSYQIIQKGVHSLMREIGPKGTAEFFKFFYCGKGDSVKEFKEMWKGMTVDNIHQDILKAKAQREV